MPGLLELDPAVAHIYVELVRRGARQLDRGQAGDVQHRLLGGAIDTAFGASGYVNAFNASGDKNYKFTSLCIVPGSRDIIIVGQETTSSGILVSGNTSSNTEMLTALGGSGVLG